MSDHQDSTHTMLTLAKFPASKRWGVQATLANGKTGFLPTWADDRKLAQRAWAMVAARLYPDGLPNTVSELRQAVGDVNVEYRCLTSHVMRREGDPFAARVPDLTGHSGGWCERCAIALPSNQAHQ